MDLNIWVKFWHQDFSQWLDMSQEPGTETRNHLLDRWSEESASVMLTIPPASDKIQQPLSCRVRCCTFWFIENIQKMLCLLSPEASECEASVVTCSANISLSPHLALHHKANKCNHGKSIPLFPCFLYFQWQLYKCCNLRWAMWCSHIVLAIEHGCSIGNAHGKKCQRWKEN